MRAQPGDLVDLVLDNRLRQYGTIACTSTATTTTAAAHAEKGAVKERGTNRQVETRL